MPLSKIQLGNTGRRNKILNGTGHIGQRSTSAAETSAFVLDRWRIDAYNQDQLALQISQSTDTPSGLGFHTSHLVNVNTAETAIANDEYLRYYQSIEARNLQDIGYGGSSPKKMQLTFWVKATGTNVTGTYGMVFWIQDANKYQNATYTISAADTWEKKTIEIGTTGHGTIANDSGIGMRINFHLMAGSDFTSGAYSNQWGTAAGSAANSHFAGGHAQNTFVQTVGNKWYMTGCQLEVSDAPTEFEHLSFAEELQLCQRYYHQLGTTSNAQMLGLGVNFGTSGAYFGQYYPVEMRATPTISVNSAASFRCHNDNGGGITGITGFGTNAQTTSKQYLIYFEKSSAFTAGSGNLLFNDVTGTYGVIKFDAEI